MKHYFYTCIIFLFSYAAMAQAPTSGYMVGDKAADFTLPDTDGKPVSLQDYKNAKGFIVVFTCNTCPFAQAYEQRIIDLHKTYAPKGYPVVAINPNDTLREPEDSRTKMAARAKEYHYPFVYLKDESQETTKLYGALRTPHVFVLQKTTEGNMVRYIGAIDDNYEDAALAKTHFVADAIEALEQGKRVNKTMTKAIGCGIKWRKKVTVDIGK